MRSLRRIFLASVLLAISVTLHSEPVGKVLKRDWHLSVKSATEARLDVTERILVNNENGDELAAFQFFTDATNSIASFSGKVEVGGKVIRKIKQSDLTTVQYSNSFADDTYINYYSPSSSYPFTVEYTWSVSLKKGIAVFPTFFPVTRADVPVEEASYVIETPEGMNLNYKSSSEPKVSGDKVRRHEWSWNGYGGFALEAGSPQILEYIPYVMACPVEFSYFGVKGRQSDWNGVGKWQYEIFPKESGLPEALAHEVHKAVDGCVDDISRLRALYDWLGANTRYVSIQLGIGGFSPMSPSAVYKTGYGDCKALSFLLRAMLEEVGISSEYTMVNTSRRRLFEEYSTVGQMDHAMLCVPMQEDTVWVECTNTRVPLGFRHSSIAGHDVVIVNDEGGRMVRPADYPDSLRQGRDDAEVVLSPDGKADVLIHRRRLLDAATEYDDFMKRDRKDALKKLSAGLKCHPDNMEIISFRDNFHDYTGTPGYVPEINLDYGFSCQTFARTVGDRIFVPVSLFTSWLSAQKTARHNDLVIEKGSSGIDSISLTVPEGYVVEVLPPETRYDCEAGWYSLAVSEDGGVIRAELGVGLIPCRLSPDSYSIYRDFTKSFNKVADSIIVLKKK